MLLKILMKKIPLDTNLQIEKSKCINLRNKFLKCRKCIDSCPEDAIEIRNKKISIDKRLCRGCGICTTVCPTQSLHIEMKENEKKYIFLRKENKKVIMIGCRNSNLHNDLRFKCLNGIRKEYLAALVLYFSEYVININTGICSNCSYGCFDKDRLTATLNDILNFFENMSIKVNVIYDQKNKKENIKKYSRRDFFKILKKNSLEAINTSKDECIQYISPKEIKFEPRKIISKYALASKEDMIKTDIFTNFDVSEKCTMCGVCVAMCSNDAWKKEEKEDKKFLLHSILKCIGCGLCIKSCPHGSISKNDLINTSLIKNEYNCKKEFDIVVCKICSNRFEKIKNDDKLCKMCKRKLYMNNY